MSVGVGVPVSDGVGVPVSVGDGVGVPVSVSVGDGVGVPDSVSVGDGDGVPDSVSVGDGVGVPDSVSVGDGDGVGVPVPVSVAVCVGVPYPAHAVGDGVPESAGLRVDSHDAAPEGDPAAVEGAFTQRGAGGGSLPWPTGMVQRMGPVDGASVPGRYDRRSAGPPPKGRSGIRRHFCGLTWCPSRIVSKCRWHPVDHPVEPTPATACPALTESPLRTAMDSRWLYVVMSPLP
ncbi:hypothetical protein A6A22_03865 [Arthrobacter sp. OY3WO11]|nr:hypothetical protein A6A22_03865 [Arthrobacter sp. OY3WO11]